MAYQSATELALIQAGKCVDRADCSSKKMAFWAGGSSVFPGSDKAYVSVYNVSDMQMIDSIKRQIKETRTSLSGPACQLTVYGGSHDSPGKKVFNETL